MRKQRDIFEKTISILDKSHILVEIEGNTRLQFEDLEEPENWPTLTALAMAVQQAQGIDNGIKEASAGVNKQIINDILQGKVHLAI